ncbi:MmcB family DNA repair protein [Parvularcula dongshanensis]|nr:MmcB family DNA repair protein [Parvularcula dongshanensis]
MNQAALKPVPTDDLPIDASAAATGRPDTTLALTRGVARLMTQMGLAVIAEFKLPNGRRADLAGLGPKGELVIVEVKSCRADLAVDTKWPEYRDYCDRFYFAVNEVFPLEMVPEDEGLIVADAFGGAILREGELRKLSGARRKAVTLRFARQAAFGCGGF